MSGPTHQKMNATGIQSRKSMRGMNRSYALISAWARVQSGAGVLISAFDGWLGQGATWRPIEFDNPISKQSPRHSKFVGPFGDRLRLSSVSDANVAPPVDRLRAPIRPNAIRRLIRAVVIQSLNTEAGWLFPHVAKKCPEISPPLTDRNPTSAVILPCGVAWIIASGKHVEPRHVRSPHRSVETIGPVRSPLLGTRFPREAAAGARIAAPQRYAWNDFRFPAVTTAKPIRALSFAMRRVLNNSPSTEPLSRLKGYEIRHALNVVTEPTMRKGLSHA